MELGLAVPMMTATTTITMITTTTIRKALKTVKTKEMWENTEKNKG